VTLELGGKSPLIIFDDANIYDAVSGAMMGNWFSNGEVCSNCTRVFVQRKVFDSFRENLVHRSKNIRIGDPQKAESQMGPLINKAQYEKVLRYIEIGKNEDKATCILDGSNLDLPSELQNGYFVGPTIFDDCTDEMRICIEEIFGPVLMLLPFDTEEEVISRANNTSFGLAAGVFTNDLNRAHRVIDQLKAGVTYINTYNTAPAEFPWGGWKQSGLGRENGLDVLKYWSEVKSVHVEPNSAWNFFDE